MENIPLPAAGGPQDGAAHEHPEGCCGGGNPQCGEGHHHREHRDGGCCGGTHADEGRGRDTVLPAR